MIIKKPKELSNYLSERQQGRGRLSLQLRNTDRGITQFNKTGSLALLDSKKIKSRLSQLFKQDKNFKKAQSSLNQQQKNKKNIVNKFFNKTFLRKKQKERSFHHLVKQKMEIVNSQNKKTEQPTETPFKIKQMKIRRKGSPFNFSVQKQNIQQVYADRYYRVLSFAKSSYTSSKVHRKPSIPQNFRIVEHKQISNNFLKNKKQIKVKEEKIPQEPLEPWEKLYQHEITEYDI